MCLALAPGRGESHAPKRAWFYDWNLFSSKGAPMRLSFEDRTYLVTGGGSGIGKGTAAALVAAGANVMIIGRNADRLSATVDEITAAGGPGSIRFEPADVTSEDEASRAVDAATAWSGRLHGVVHCA